MSSAISLRKRFFLKFACFEWVLLIHTIILTLLMRYKLLLQPQPLWGFTIGFEFAGTTFLFSVICAVLRFLYLWIRKGREAAVRFARSLLRVSQAIDWVRILFWINLAAFGYIWLKVFLPLLNARVFDAALYKIDLFIHFGVDPNRFLIALFPYPWFLQLMDKEYILYHPSIIAGVSWFLIASSRSNRFRLVGAYTVMWIVSAWLYLAVPSLGPCYKLPEDYLQIQKYMPMISAEQTMLIRHYFFIRSSADKAIGMAIPLLGVAAFPSMHVGAQCFLAFWARKRNRFLFILFSVLTFLTFIASLVSGWHYAVDGYAGVLLAYVCARLFDKPKRKM